MKTARKKTTKKLQLQNAGQGTTYTHTALISVFGERSLILVT